MYIGVYTAYKGCAYTWVRCDFAAKSYLRPRYEHGFVTTQDCVKNRHKPNVFEALDTTLRPAMRAIRLNIAEQYRMWQTSVGMDYVLCRMSM